MKIIQISKAFVFVAVAALTGCQTSSGGGALSFEALKAEGYRVSKLTTSPGGSKGWYLSRQKERFFCSASYSVVELSPGKHGIITSGKVIPVDLAAYKSYGGYDDFVPPKLSNLKAGRIRSEDVGRCSKMPT